MGRSATLNNLVLAHMAFLHSTRKRKFRLAPPSGGHATHYPRRNVGGRGSEQDWFERFGFQVGDFGVLKRFRAHQPVIAAWSTTVGHNATPTDSDRIPAFPRMTTAPTL